MCKVRGKAGMAEQLRGQGLFAITWRPPISHGVETRVLFAYLFRGESEVLDFKFILKVG
jgi:hypothetical protein